MPLFFQKDIDQHTRLAVWNIDEPEAYFLAFVPLQNSITHPSKRLQHLAGRYLLQHLFPSFPYHLIKIADTRKPFLPDEQYHFSISHCARYAAAIVSTASRVGIDVEVITNRVAKIKHKFLHTSELRFVHSRPANQQEQLLTILWSAKEAIYKWYGLGEVDFSDMMAISPFRLQESGEMACVFKKKDFSRSLQLRYMVWNDIVLVWVVSDVAI